MTVARRVPDTFARTGTGAGGATGAAGAIGDGSAANDNCEPRRQTFCQETGGPSVWKLRWALMRMPYLYKCTDGTWAETPFNLGPRACAPWINK